MISTLKERLPQWNNDSDSNVAFALHGDEAVLAICTPLMKRVHGYIHQSSEVVFVDSTGCLHMNSSIVFTASRNESIASAVLATSIP